MTGSKWSLRAPLAALLPLVLCACATPGARWNPPAVPALTPPPGRAGRHFDCNAPRGGSAHWFRPAPGKSLAISGALQIERFKDDPPRISNAYIDLVLAGGRTVNLTIEDLDKGMLGILLTDSTAPRAEHIVGTIPLYPRPVPFYLQLTADSLLHVAVGDVRGSMQLADARPVGVALACWSTRLYYSNVVVAAR